MAIVFGGGKVEGSFNFLAWIVSRIGKAEQVIGDGKVGLTFGCVGSEIPAYQRRAEVRGKETVGAGSPRGSEHTHILAASHLGIMNEGLELHQRQGCGPRPLGRTGWEGNGRTCKEHWLGGTLYFSPGPSPTAQAMPHAALGP